MSEGNIYLWPKRLSIQHPLTFQNWSHNHHMLVESCLTLLANSFLKNQDKKIQVSNSWHWWWKFAAGGSALTFLIAIILSSSPVTEFFFLNFYPSCCDIHDVCLWHLWSFSITTHFSFEYHLGSWLILYFSNYFKKYPLFFTPLTALLILVSSHRSGFLLTSELSRECYFWCPIAQLTMDVFPYQVR